MNDIRAIVSIFIANQGDPGLFQEQEAEVKRNLRDFLVQGRKRESRRMRGAASRFKGLSRNLWSRGFTGASRSGNRYQAHSEVQRASSRGPSDISLVSDHQA